VVRSVNLPAAAVRPVPVRGAPVENGVVGCPYVPKWAPVHGHGCGPGRQGGCHHTAGQGARLVKQDADLYVRHAVQVEHDVAASSVDPARAQALPHLAEKLPPKGGEVLPRRRRGHDCGPAGLDLRELYLVVHLAIIRRNTARPP
jgi:hypothetical protein